MPSYTLHHLHHESADVDGAVAWYQSNFDGELTERIEKNGVQWARIMVGGALLNITDRGDHDVPLARINGFDHFCLHTSDFDATVAALKAAGVHFFAEPMSPKAGVRIAFVCGPDNVKIEILGND